jgi:hypothetical protein
METEFKKIFLKERIVGFFLYAAALSSLDLFKIIFSKSQIDLPAIVTYILSGVLFFVAFFGLSNKSYKFYAQGALANWLLFVVLSLLIIIFV